METPMAASAYRIIAPLCLLLLPIPAAAGNSVLTGSVHLRTGPGIGFARLATLPRGGVVHVSACTQTGSWCHVSFGNLSGWASARYLAATVPVPVQVPVVPQVVPQVGGYVVGGYAGVIAHPVVPTVLPPAGYAPFGHATHAYPPSVVVHSHSSRYPGRVVHHQQMVTTQQVVTYPTVSPYVYGGVVSYPFVSR